MTELLYMLGFETQRMSQPGELALDKAMRINEEVKEELTFCLNMAKQSHNTLMVNKLTKILNSLS